ncbi:MAG: class I SAM-dependent methyltransferase, partial [Anaerolineales bacterium]
TSALGNAGRDVQIVPGSASPHPEAEVVGLDGDPEVLEIGRQKAARAGVTLTLDGGMAYQLPYPEASFDRVLSSLMFHHLTLDDKGRALRESWRVLRPGGEIHIVDFGKPHTAWGRLIAPLVGRAERASDNIQGRLPDLLHEAGFEQVMESARFATVVGTVSAYQGRKPA